jgi:hypothetical protein
MQKESRDIARPKLKTVNDAIEELALLVNNDTEDFHEKWKAILDKYDINYNNTERWNI